MQNEQNQNQANNNYDPESESLERPASVVESSPETGGSSPADQPEIKPELEPPVKKKRLNLKNLPHRVNIYFLLFLLILIIAAVVTVVSFIQSRQADKGNEQASTEPLSQEALDQLRRTDVKVGDPKQILTVEANAIFAGKVLIKDSLEVAGNIKSGSTITATGLSVTGNSILDQVQSNRLQVSGEANIQGPLAIQNNLSVSGSGSFGGTLTAARLNIQDLQINGDLQINRHINPGGPTPGRTNGSALGAGGTSSVSGTDTAGTITINTGGGPGAGCFVTVNFSQRFNDTPHVVITPVGAAAAGLNYYINRSPTNFSVCTTNGAPSGQNFAFDYVAID